MYLCNLKITGKSLPSTLPANIKNEVSSMVDIINFSVVDEGGNGGGSSAPAGNVPDFSGRGNTASPPSIQHPQPQPTASQLLQAQMTGYPGQQQQQPLQTGFLGQQPTGMPTGLLGPQGYAGPRPPMPPMPTGFGQPGPSLPLNAQPTGRPGQWGLVNTPASGLPNIDALAARMMPQQQGREGPAQGGYSTAGLQGNAEVPWSITKDEKTSYDAIFRAWDGLHKGFIAGAQAIQIFEQSGLAKSDLERIWTLADNGNKGRLDLDEFAVAMHLIYRKLNGYPVPSTLPPELVPPSTRNFAGALGALKGMLHEESDFRKNSGAALLPQRTGVSYQKAHSFRPGAGGAFGGSRKDATVFKNDDSVGYRSSARRRVAGGSDSPRPDSPSGSVTSNNEDLSVEQLRKKVREKQILLDAMDFKDEQDLEEDDLLDRRDRKEADELYRRVRRVQDDIDAHPDAGFASADSEAERRSLKRTLQNLADKVPDLASHVRRTEKAIADARLELFRLRDAKAHPGSASAIVGTGPGGAVTESDRLKARAKAMMQQRTAALTGRKVDASDDVDAAPKRLEEESIKVRGEKEGNERMVRDVEESVRDFAKALEDSLKDGGRSNASEHERRRWEDALGVEDEVRDFIMDMQRNSRAARVRAQDRRSEERSSAARAGGSAGRSEAARGFDTPTSSRTATPPASTSSPAPAAPAAAAGGGSYSSYKTPEERAAFIKAQAEARMAERLAALGIRAPSKPGESPAQKAERERAERAAKLRQAEEEDARREQERQLRLNDEMGVPSPAKAAAPQADKKPPPPPASRKAAPVPDARKEEEERLARERDEQHRATAALE